MSRNISQTKADYYHGLQAVRDDNEWQPWLLYMLRGVALTARHTSQLVSDIRELLQHHKQRIRGSFKFYSQDLLNNIFWHPYTKAAFLAQDMNVSHTPIRAGDRVEICAKVTTDPSRITIVGPYSLPPPVGRCLRYGSATLSTWMQPHGA